MAKKAYHLITKEITFISDIDECSVDNGCHSDADCTNTPASYICQCRNGFFGDGKNCRGIQNQKNLLNIYVSSDVGEL